MINTLYLPELRELLAESNAGELCEFCTALHPAQTAEFMEGLEPAEAWEVLKYADTPRRVEIFGYIERGAQVEIVERSQRDEIGRLIADLPADDRVDLLNDIDPVIVGELLPLLPADERRDILRLRAHPEGTAGSLMTSEFARLSEAITVKDALEEIGRQSENLETIYYIYIVDDDGHLRGLVSARQLLSSLGRPQTKIADLMLRDLVTVNVTDSQETVTQKAADYDLLAVPVVDDAYHLLGIITHDDVIDVVREEATEDAHRMSAVDPLKVGYLETHWFTLTWKRVIWLVTLLFAAMLTAFALDAYRTDLQKVSWLVLFIPLVISSGGNSGSQSATLVITALTTGDLMLSDWWRVVKRELLMGVCLGGFLGVIGYFMACTLTPDMYSALVIPITLLLVVICGTLSGSILPLVFRRLGLDPALMSTPFVAAIIDIAGVIIYMRVAASMLETA